MLNWLLVLLLSTTACGDKEPADPIETADSQSAHSESVDSDSASELCAIPTFVPDKAYTWASRTSYGGYALAATNGRAYIASPVDGSVMGIPWGTPSGYVESSYDLIMTGTAYSPDKVTRSGEWLGIADAAYTDEDGNMTGRLLVAPAEGVDKLYDVIPAEAVAVFSIRGYRDTGYTGAFLAGYIDDDEFPDAVTQSGPLPGELAIFSDMEYMSGEYTWDQASIVIDACAETGRVIYAPVSMTVFGNDFLAAGCPGNDYRGGEAWIWSLPIEEGVTPTTIITSVSGWSVSSEGIGFPLFVDARDGNMVGVIYDDGSDEPIGSSITFSSGAWWGTDPTAISSPNGECGVLVVGEPSAVTKSGDTGAVWAIALDQSGMPTGEWKSLTIPSSEVSPTWIGSVIAVSQDSSRLAVSGWQENSGMGGGLVTYEIVWP